MLIKVTVIDDFQSHGYDINIGAKEIAAELLLWTQ